MLDYCFNHLGLHKVIAHVTESNAAVSSDHGGRGFPHETPVAGTTSFHATGRPRISALLSCLSEEFRERFPTGGPAPK